MVDLVKVLYYTNSCKLVVKFYAKQKHLRFIYLGGVIRALGTFVMRIYYVIIV